MSSPRDALSAISSVDTRSLDVFGIALLFFFGRLPGCDQMVIFALRITPDLENHGAKASTAPANGTELFRVVVLLVDQVETWSKITPKRNRYGPIWTRFEPGHRPKGSWSPRMPGIQLKLRLLPEV
jgi:hypothetical protein